MNLDELINCPTSIWLDDLSRAKLSGSDAHSLPSRIATSAVVGVTTNPSIFSSAISSGAEYAKDISSMKGSSVDEVIEKLTTDDVRAACDLLYPIYKSSKGIDGRVTVSYTHLTLPTILRV